MYCELACPSMFLKNHLLIIGNKYMTVKNNIPNDKNKRIQKTVFISPPTTFVIIPSKIKTVNTIFDGHYDVISFFDSLEHFDDIYFLDKLQCDYICISVPWCHNFNDEWFENWKHRRPDEHLWHFDEKSLRRFVESQNYEYVNHTNIEDSIRKTEYSYPNILTSIFKKVK